jgi:3-methyladenine DNA glycosylase/8-oxoguanine DNA glycosylase
MMSSIKNLTCKTTLELTPTSPFNFDATFYKPDHFPSTDNAWKPGVRWHTMLWQGCCLGLKIENIGTLERPRLALHVFSEDNLEKVFLDGLVGEIIYRFNLDMDLAEFYKLFENDAYLSPLIHRWRGMRPMNPGSLYEYLVIAIVLQNATVRRSVDMLQALFKAYGSQLNYDGKELSAFWQPQTLYVAEEGDLRLLKVGYRAKSLKRVTQAFVSGEIDEMSLRGATQDEQRRVLLGLYGIGPASVGYLLFDVFHRVGEMEHISPWEQKIYSRLFFGVDTETPVPVDQLLDFFSDNFGQFSRLAVNYFWEDLFWKRRYEPVDWLEKLIRL